MRIYLFATPNMCPACHPRGVPELGHVEWLADKGLLCSTHHAAKWVQEGRVQNPMNGRRTLIGWYQ